MTINAWVVAIVGLLLALVIISIWRQNWITSSVRYISRDEMPIWLSILLAVSAALGTYILAPIINEDFEFQKNRSAHVLSTVTDMNKDITDLSKNVRKFNDSLFYKKADLGDRRSDALDKITEIQWKLIDVGVVIKRAHGDVDSIPKLGMDLETLQRSIIESTKPEDQEKVIVAFGRVSSTSRTAINALYSAARLD